MPITTTTWRYELPPELGWTGDAVVIPTPEHFSRFGGMYRAMRIVFQLETGADVLIMSNEGGGAS